MLPGLFFLLSSCKKDNGDLVQFSELGAVSREYIVSPAKGVVAVQVLANKGFTAKAVDSASSWIHLDSLGEMNKDSLFNVKYDANAAGPRMGKIVLFAPESQRRDTVVIKQKGVSDPLLQFVNANASVLGRTDNVLRAVLRTNVPFKQLTSSVTYVDSSQSWVANDFNLTQDSIFTFTVKANPSQSQLRSAQVKLSFTDGWGEEHSTTLYLLQSNSLDLFGNKIEFPDARALAGFKVSTDVFIEGYVVSDKASMNMGDVVQTTTTTINYAANTTTAYIESLDGKYGFKIVTATAADNVFARYSKVQILLKGTTVGLEADPNRYTITGVTSAMVMSQVGGTAAVLPLKEKYMADLTDDDVFTYTTIKSCELPIRKGPLTPVNEGYTPLFNANRINKYPLLMRDEQGNSMYLLTNLNCPYRRDASVLPSGSGKIAGVVVHETFPRFDYQDAADEANYGNIGRFQLRHVSKSDIQLSTDISDNFSALLVEYRYPNIVSGVAYPNNGSNGSLRSSAGVNIAATSDYTYLGLCGATNLGNTNLYGNGVLLPGGAKQNTSTSTNSDGKGAAASSALNCTCLWWNTAKARGEAWVLQLSTANISTDQLSLQLTAFNWASAGAGTPRYWRVEWSETGDMDGAWNTVAKYTVPDAPNFSNTLVHQLPGFKNINVPLPLSLLGKSSVYIRLIVDKNLCSTGTTYATAGITASLASSIGYLAIRYNK
jgi:hypothetical protein